LCLVQLGKGAELKTALHDKAVGVANAFLEISNGALFMLASGKAKPVRADIALWPERAPSRFHSAADFATKGNFQVSFFSTPGHEIFAAGGACAAHLDRPLTATGARFAYQSDALYLRDRTRSADTLALIGQRPDVAKPIYSLSLENALIGVD